MTELEALLILNAVPGLGNDRIRQLKEHGGSASRILTLSEAELTHLGLNANLIQKILQFPRDTFLKSELETAARRHVQIITFDDPGYPVYLGQIPDAPVLLYVLGSIVTDQTVSVAMVGSRRCSVYGLSICTQLSTALAERGVTIVSGMARGIDTAAHKGALRAGGRTVAVLGCGLSHVYPPENKDLMQEIALGGAVISELPLETPPYAFNFPRRNRIISGLSLGVVVVEAALRSGALITADCALEQGREVFAVPGMIDNPTAGGTHHLIKQGAKLVTCVEDILEELNLTVSADPVSRALEEKEAGEATGVPACSEVSPSVDVLRDLTQAQKNVYECLGDQPLHIDELAGRCDQAGPTLGSALLQLELRHLVKQLPGKFFVKYHQSARAAGV